MKIAITSQGKELNADVDPRFGRCQYFIIYDTGTSTFENIENPNINTGSGAGIQSAKTIAEREVEAVLTGHVGPNAFQTLSASKIKIYTDVSGIVSEAIQKFQTGDLKPDISPSVESHHGMGKGQEQEIVSKPAGKKRIVVAAGDDKGLEAKIGAHFGRCPYYTIVDVEGDKMLMSYKVENPYFNAHQPGQVPGFIRDQQADVMISGGMGQRAVQFFTEFGIESVTGAAGTVKETIEAYLTGKLTGTAPCSGHHDHGCE